MLADILQNHTVPSRRIHSGKAHGVHLVSLPHGGCSRLLFLPSPSYGQLFPEPAAPIAAPHLSAGAPEPKQAHSQWKICQNETKPPGVLKATARTQTNKTDFTILDMHNNNSFTHLMVTVTSSILSVVMSPVMWCLTAVRVKMLGADLMKEG